MLLKISIGLTILMGIFVLVADMLQVSLKVYIASLISEIVAFFMLIVTISITIIQCYA